MSFRFHLPHFVVAGSSRREFLSLVSIVFSFSAFHFRCGFLRIRTSTTKGATMKKDEAIAIMHHLATKLEDVVAVEDLVAPYAEFMAHIQADLTEEVFAFLATVGAAIYMKGSRQYDSSVQAELLLEKVRCK
jgi:hypothetical protein